MSSSRVCPPNAASRRMAPSRAKKPAARRPKRAPHDVVLRITLGDIDPPIWREIALLDTTTLPELHRIFQLAFQWYDYHLHQFTIGAERYAIPDDELDDFGVPTRSVHGVTLTQLGLTDGAHFTYEYDFGDSWTHRVEVRKMSPASDRAELMPRRCSWTDAVQPRLKTAARPQVTRNSCAYCQTRPTRSTTTCAPGSGRILIQSDSTRVLHDMR